MIKRSRLRLVAVLLGVMLVAAACGSDSGTDETSGAGDIVGDPFSVVASSDLTTGENRFLLGFRDTDGTLLGSPSDLMTISYYPEGDPASAEQADGTFVWIVPDVTGLYRATVSFDRPGAWVVEADLAGTAIPGSTFLVKEVPDTPALGEAAPASVTPTGSDFALDAITTDPNPDPAFYEVSVDEALASGKPSVIVFSTPAFCVSQACGPMLDLMKGLSREWPEVNWIHVEVFENIQDPENRRYVSAVTEWSLPTEPWLFITDEAGLVAAKYEGVVDAGEVSEMLGRLG